MSSHRKKTTFNKLRIAERQREAADRQAIRDARTPEQQLTVLDARGAPPASRERAKIAKQIVARDEQAAIKAKKEAKS